MLRKIYRTYKNIIDEQLSSSTFLVWIIACLIISVWILVPNNTLAYSKNNILEFQKVNNKKLLESNNLVNINWKIYKIYFEEIK